MGLENFERKIATLERFNWQQELIEIITDNVDELEQLQREQMASGKDSHGNDTTLDGAGYAPYTMLYKSLYGEGIGADTDKVTGYMTGDLYSRLKAVVSGTDVNIESDVPYFLDLLKRTGEQWTGLDEEKRKEFASNIVLPAIKDRFTAALL